MDTNASIKRRRASDCSASSATLIESSSLLGHWNAFPWGKFPGFTVSERAGRQDFVDLAALLRYSSSRFTHEEEMGLQALPLEAEAQDSGLFCPWYPKHREASVQGA